MSDPINWNGPMTQKSIKAEELKIGYRELRKLETDYPGILNELRRLIIAGRAVCPRCQSTQTAVVLRGMIGRTIALAAATPRVKLLPPGQPNHSHCCRACGHGFSASGAPVH